MSRLLFRLLQETNSTSPPKPSPPHNPDLVLILAVLLCALTCFLGLLIISRCSWLRRTVSRSDQTHPPLPLANKGVKKKVLRLLPKFTYSPEEELKTCPMVSGNSKLLECTICLTEFVAGDELRILPQCGHGFHVSCIDTWLGSHSSCPSCRQILVVTRCHKCGGLPGGSSSGSESDTRIKESEDNHDPHNFLP